MPIVFLKDKPGLLFCSIPPIFENRFLTPDETALLVPQLIDICSNSSPISEVQVPATLIIPASGHTLSAGLRELTAENGETYRIELAPQSVFAGDPEFLSSDLSDWTIVNGTNHTIDANTTALDRLAITPTTIDATVWFNNSRTGPFIYQILDGDFDVYMNCSTGPTYGNPDGFWNAGFMTQSTSDDTDWLECSWETRTGGKFRVTTTVNDATTEYLGATNWSAGDVGAWIGGMNYLRIARVGNDISTYGWLQGSTGFELLRTITRSDYSTDTRIGLVFYSSNGNTTNPVVLCDFIRNWPPYLTTEPTSDIVIDSGADDTIWDMSTFLPVTNPYQEYNTQPQIGFGSISYQYGAGNSNPPALNGSDLTEAQMQAEVDPTGRYFRLQVKYTSPTGIEEASFQGASIHVTLIYD